MISFTEKLKDYMGPEFNYLGEVHAIYDGQGCNGHRIGFQGNEMSFATIAGGQCKLEDADIVIDALKKLKPKQ